MFSSAPFPGIAVQTPHQVASTVSTMAFNRSFLSVFALVSLLTHLSSTLAFPSYNSLAGLSEREVEELVARLPQVLPPNPPGPLEFNGTKMVNDLDHHLNPLRKGDIRGPCPGLNTLASHGVSEHIPLALFELSAFCRPCG